MHTKRLSHNQVRYIILPVLALALASTLLYSCQSNMGAKLIGTWENTTLNVQTNTAQGQDTTINMMIENGQWEEKLGIKPIITTYLEDGSFKSEYFGPDGKPVGTEEGTWRIRNDSLVLKSGGYNDVYKVIFEGEQARFISYLDWDQDGEADDLYDGWQVRTSGTEK